ncbi:Vesicle-associated protein 1-1 [Rhynchospora pubera]|uniref:Vesicle-associated protein 1-1 n=1 Tax=Rhynchospora pubera TaxID=906938 RepID=A0AAV8CT57_9POAL|nr:Vesicle-associated protein 1-1 [Rhynchospora pubera]KAJ4759170.1 Vesicle-associated protein 1-1 [Rhynchospora pubera]KAJ4799835.1 Vesicle-associated protein 1-1 [Rhynchospora pubera]
MLSAQLIKSSHLFSRLVSVSFPLPFSSSPFQNKKSSLNPTCQMGGGDNSQLISVYPEELSFQIELEKPSSCNLKIVNNTEHHVAFKVKTTSPKKYFVRPNARIIQPWDSCSIIVTLQAQKELPADMQCKDKFLIQSSKVAPSTDMDEIPPDTFTKEGDKVIDEMKLRVVYKNPTGRANLETSGMTSLPIGSDDISMLKNPTSQELATIQRLKEERDTTLQLNQQLQRELDMLRRRRHPKSGGGFSFIFAIFVGLLGLFVGLILNLSLATPAASTE